jgi:hypothetical protein
MGGAVGHFGWPVCSVLPLCLGFEMLFLACESGLHAELGELARMSQERFPGGPGLLVRVIMGKR